MTVAEQILTVAVVALMTMVTRFSPFLVFNSDKPTPKFLEYLGKALPPAVFAMLVVYCFKSVSLLSSPYGIPELLAAVAVIALHLIFRKMLLSIVAGTVFYMVLVNLVFV